ncbi:hypothetical protein [Bradyrhizobium sp. CB2312]|uniref:hypothetical protein n=1 Tax=Bradyrhizobium sp. CB2312 TaxID=3039155 RepID=UPI0024B042FC|nr:hypothetical protein [Bradyrhizobium sp. CB2312]WFU71152.1 hypothetical protein QA642_38835 [Bradyrhizobium sp. CB2312]
MTSDKADVLMIRSGSTVNLFDRAVHRVERELAINEQALQRSQREQDGSEAQSVQPDRLEAAS